MLDAVATNAKGIRSLETITRIVFGQGVPLIVTDGRVMGGHLKSLENYAVTPNGSGVVAVFRPLKEGDKVEMTLSFNQLNSGVDLREALHRVRGLDNPRRVVAVDIGGTKGNKNLVLSSGVPERQIRFMKYNGDMMPIVRLG